MRYRRAALFVGASALAAAGIVACGSRTGLLLDDTAAPSSGVEAGIRRDARVPVDGFVEDALPPIDARPLHDAQPLLCADAGATLIYVVSNTDELLSFDPSSGTFSPITQLACDDPDHPFSMAVDHKGTAYVLYYAPPAQVGAPTKPGRLYRVSLATGACAPTAFVPGQLGFNSFGMGFSADNQGVGETLYVANAGDTGRLGSIDVKTFVLSDIGVFKPPVVYHAELSGSGDGRLYAFFDASQLGQPGSAIAEIDKATAKIVAQTLLPLINQGQAWAFGFWGGDFYMFTTPNDASGAFSNVTRYRPSDGSLSHVATYTDGAIVGAGVSTCAPSQ
jgi:hypothetical protein